MQTCVLACPSVTCARLSVVLVWSVSERQSNNAQLAVPSAIEPNSHNGRQGYHHMEHQSWTRRLAQANEGVWPALVFSTPSPTPVARLSIAARAIGAKRKFQTPLQAVKRSKDQGFQFLTSTRSEVRHRLPCRYSFPGFSWNSIFGKFMIFVTDAELSRQVLSVNGKDSLLMALHPSAKNILGEQNLAFMHGPEHKAIRKSFLSLFTRKALGTYVEIQDGIIRSHIAQWLQDLHGEVEIRNHVRYSLLSICFPSTLSPLFPPHPLANGCHTNHSRLRR